MLQALRAHLKQAFFQVADHMRNRPESGAGGGLRIVAGSVDVEG